MFSRLSTAALASAFLEAKRAKGLSPRTIETYHYRLTAFARQNPELPLSPEPIEAILADAGPEPETRHQHFRILRTFYRWLAKRGVIETNPIDLVEPPRLPPKVARSLSRDQLRQLLRYPCWDVLRAFLWLLSDTGLRLSEGWRLAKGDMDSRIITVKGKVGERQVPITPYVRNMVLNLPGERPFAERWSSRQAAGLAVKRAFNRVGFTGKRASAHTLRHTFVRLWEGDENLLVGILGWTSARMLKVYRPYDITRAMRQHRRYSPIKKLLA